LLLKNSRFVFDVIFSIIASLQLIHT
jgi:hypothetical protein